MLDDNWLHDMDKQKLLGLIRAFLLALVICLLLGSCKTTKVIDEHEHYERVSVSIDSLKTDSISVNTSHVLTTQDSEIETIRVIEVYSAPDSLGNQYIVSKETITNKAINKITEERNDSSAVNCATNELKGHIEAENKDKDNKTEIKTDSSGFSFNFGIITGIIFILIILFILLYFKVRFSK